jgi:Rod binding domain-containing protein
MTGITPVLPTSTNKAADPLYDACRQFEGEFARMLVAAMERSLPGKTFLPGAAPGTYNLFVEDALVQTLTSGTGLGLAASLYRQLSATQSADASPKGKENSTR